MQDRIGRAILKTLIYSDIFDYPLSKNELWNFLICQKIDRKSLEESLKDNLPKKISFRKSFYHLSGREKIIKMRIKRKKESRRKIVIAKKIIKQLSRIPTIKFVGISGALSLENSERDDDIDLFVIVSKGTLWLTRLAMIILLLIIGRYRRRNQEEVSDKICLNMIIDDSVLRLSGSRQNLYTAHEIVQMMPVFGRNNMYKKFMIANEWVGKFLPNVIDTKISRYKDIKRSEEKSLSILVSQYLNISLKPFEWFAKSLQLWFIKKHITTETISDNLLAFHPFDYGKHILNLYNRRLRNYRL